MRSLWAPVLLCLPALASGAALSRGQPMGPAVPGVAGAGWRASGIPALPAPSLSLTGQGIGSAGAPVVLPSLDFAAPAALAPRRGAAGSAALPASVSDAARLEEAGARLAAAAPEPGGPSQAAALEALFTGARPAGGAYLGPEPVLPPDYLPVPVTVQETDYSCGAAAVRGVLRYWNAYDGDESTLYPILDTRPKDGTPPENIARGLRSFGLEADLREGMTLGDLRSALRAGKTVILMIQAWRDDPGKPWGETWDSGHYVALAGMDERFVYAMDPSTEERYAYLPAGEFLERWHDFEDRDGTERRYLQAGIVASGRTAMPRPGTPPDAPGRLDLKRGPQPRVRH